MIEMHLVFGLYAFRVSFDVFLLIFLPPKNTFWPFLQVNSMWDPPLLNGQVLSGFNKSNKFESGSTGFGKFHL
jgi:hypothetical protein